MKHLSLTIGIASLISLSSFGSAANAGTISFSDSIPMTLTDWDNLSVDLQKFDSSHGTLNSVELTLKGNVEGDVFFESQSGSVGMITTSLGSIIELDGPNGHDLEVTSLIERVDSVASFDGINDFDGGSGKTLLDLNSSKSVSLLFTDEIDLSLFTGSGFINLAALATGTSIFTGPGNVIAESNNSAGADVTVTYNFTTSQTSVPESSSILGMSVAVAAIGSFVSKRRVKQA